MRAAAAAAARGARPSAPAAGGGGKELSSGAWSPVVSKVGSIQEELVVQPGWSKSAVPAVKGSVLTLPAGPAAVALRN